MNNTPAAPTAIAAADLKGGDVIRYRGGRVEVFDVRVVANSATVRIIRNGEVESLHVPALQRIWKF